jgi:hypothetical protein
MRSMSGMDVVSPGCARRHEAAKFPWVDGRALHVDGDVQPHRPRPAGSRQEQRLIEMPGDVFGSFDKGRILGNAADHGNDLALLVAQLPQPGNRRRRQAGGALDLARNDDHRHRVGPGAENAVQRIDAARAGGDVQDRRLSAMRA